MQAATQQYAPINTRHYIPWLDYAKVIGIFLMIWGHAAHSSPGVRLYIWSFHMPLFFIISGMLYKPLTLKETLKKDWRSLVIPYLLLNLVCWMYFLVLQTIKGTISLESLYHNAGAILLGLGYNTNIFYPVSTACWFIYSLFLARIILALAYRGKPGNLLSLSVFTVAVTAVLQYEHIDLWIPVDSTLLVMPFICVGIFFRDAIIKFAENSKYWSFAALLIFAAAWYILATCNGRVDANCCRPGNSLALYYAVAFLGTLSLFKCSQTACKVLSFNALSGGGKIPLEMHFALCGAEPAGNRHTKVGR